jgi:uncharacterized protein YkwD
MPSRTIAVLLAACAMLAGRVATGASADTGRAPDLGDVTRIVVDETNRLRQEHQLAPLRPNPRLTATAREFADYMARTDLYGHRADGREPAHRAEAHGYAYCLLAENIAYEFNSGGFETHELAADLTEGWARSSGHRRNILDDGATEIGVAVAHSPNSGRYYAVQMFGRPQAERRSRLAVCR